MLVGRSDELICGSDALAKLFVWERFYLMLRHLPQFICLIAGLVLAPLSSTHAGVVGRADIDWTTLAVSYYPFDNNNPLDVQLDGHFGSISVNAATADPWDSQWDGATADDWSTPLSGGVDTAHAWADALRSSGELSASANAEPGVSAAAPNVNYGQAESYNSVGFTITGEGVVVLSVQWNLAVEGAMYDDDNVASALASLTADYANESFRGSISNEASLLSFDDGNKSATGRFLLSIVNEAGMTTTGTLTAMVSANAYATNVVPEPSTFALTGLGLMVAGLAVCRRRC